MPRGFFCIIDLTLIMLSWATKLEQVLQSTPFFNNLNDLSSTASLCHIDNFFFTRVISRLFKNALVTTNLYMYAVYELFIHLCYVFD